MLKTILLTCLAAAMACAQDNVPVTGPIAGFVFDTETAALRPIVGVPGASYLGPAILAGLERALVSPDGATALAVREGRLHLISGLRNGTPALVAIEGAIADVDRMAWSPTGDLAAVYASATGQAQVLRDLPRKPAASELIAVEGAVSALAVSATGDLIAALKDGVYLYPAGAAPRLLASAGTVTALALRGRNLFAAETAANRILSIEEFAGSPAVSTFTEGVEMPVGVQLSADGKRLLVAGGKSKVLSVYDVAARYAMGRVELDCTPSELRPAGGPDLWLLNSDARGDDPLYLATADGDPAAWFVPAGREQ